MPQDRSQPNIFESDFTAGPAGVCTEDVGVVRGRLTLRTVVDRSGDVVLYVQYRDGAEWYVVHRGQLHLDDRAGVRALHELALAHLREAGHVEGLRRDDRSAA